MIQSVQMKQALIFTLAMWVTRLAWGANATLGLVAGEPRAQPVFQPHEAQPMAVGTLEGDDEPYQTWRGEVSGKPVYVELHGDALRLQVAKRTFLRKLSGAARSAGSPVMLLDTRGTALFAGAGPRPPSSAIVCLESLPASASRDTPDKAVFVVLDLLGSPKVYQLPPLQAACAGLVVTAPGGYKAPVWEPSPDAAGAYRMKGHRAVRSLGAEVSGLGTVKSCVLNADGMSVTLLKSHRIGDTFAYSIRLPDGGVHPIFDGDDDQSRGTLSKVVCAGTQSARALVMSGEFFGSGYPKGVVYAWNAALRQLERVEFAEHAFPSRVQLNPAGMRLLIPSQGGDATTKFVLYRHDVASGKTEVIATDTGDALGGKGVVIPLAEVHLPKEVSEFLSRREACDHFRGEVIDPPDAKLKKERNDNIRTYCKGTDAALARLRQKYAKRRDVVQSLRAFEARIEASRSQSEAN